MLDDTDPEGGSPFSTKQLPHTLATISMLGFEAPIKHESDILSRQTLWLQNRLDLRGPD